eukprot:2996548-Amphidinium_carterae.1
MGTTPCKKLARTVEMEEPAWQLSTVIFRMENRARFRRVSRNAHSGCANGAHKLSICRIATFTPYVSLRGKRVDISFVSL